MAFTEYKYSKDTIVKLIEKLKAGMVARGKEPDLLASGLHAIKFRLDQDKRSYRDYGPWWWSLKDVMNRNGHYLGSMSHPIIAREYRFDDDLQTLIAADKFRTAYQKKNIIYTNQFLLDADSPDFYTLFDEDMEFSIEDWMAKYGNGAF